MYILGILFYVVTIASLFIFDALNELLHQAIFLAPEVAFAIFVVCLYPLAIFLYHLVRRKNAPENKKYLSSQAKLAASVSLSLGLIGTFEGLTEMVSAISKSMMTDGKDLSETMTQMVSSISSALASMSYAFITSIFGVASSVLVIISYNYISTYYRDKDTALTSGTPDAPDDSYVTKLNDLEKVNISILEKLLSCHQQNDIFCKNTEILAKEIVVTNALMAKRNQFELNAWRSVINKMNTLISEGRNVDTHFENIASLLTQNNRLLTASQDAGTEIRDILQKQSTSLEFLTDTMKSGSYVARDIYTVLEDMQAHNKNIPTILQQIDGSLSESSTFMKNILSHSEKREQEYRTKMKKISEVLSNE